ncbi:MAG: RsmB/NOP family class I SAM-dependent RNA methyltransferase [Candidatus Heimdallarchaeota archaeon]|nr:RsmB/NOP family class I SAM-dependent RNA methyltransferase [Candidatus Heimdallarchaeota archaeon]MCK4954917.1 RsmB/NOP family class I SAM-dependent RNA methyltransferase [Candidatus Heimdallarchaeota archaeon]
MDSIIPFVIEILGGALRGKSSRIALRSAVETNKLNREEESALYYLVFEILRRLNVIDLYIKTSTSSYSLKKISSDNRAILRIATYLMKIENKDIEFVNNLLSSHFEQFSESNFLTILDLIQSVSEEQLYENRNDLASNLSIEYFTPTWIVRKFLSQWGVETTKKILPSFQQNLHLYVRINTIKANLEEILRIFHLNDISYSIVEEIENLVRIEENEIPIPQLEAFKEGKILIQQKASALVSLVLDPQEDDEILDMCASPGGKTSHIAALLKNKGKIVAVDMNDERVKILKDRMNLLGIKLVRIIQTDARELHRKIETRFDKILLDPPCSGSGTYSSRPENKWRMNQRDLGWYVNLQKDLLNEAAVLLKTGGSIVYSTCSLFHEENHSVILDFLQENSNFKLVETTPMVGVTSKILNEKTQELYPHIHETEGFFIAKIQKE